MMLIGSSTVMAWCHCLYYCNTYLKLGLYSNCRMWWINVYSIAIAVFIIHNRAHLLWFADSPSNQGKGQMVARYLSYFVPLHLLPTLDYETNLEIELRNKLLAVDRAMCEISRAEEYLYWSHLTLYGTQRSDASSP